MPFAELTRADRLPKFDVVQYRLLIVFISKGYSGTSASLNIQLRSIVSAIICPTHLIQVFSKDDPKPFRESVLSCIVG